MKKLLLICMCYFMFITSRAQTGNGGENGGTSIDFSTEIINPSGSGDIRPRGPVCPPEAMLSGHTLYILTEHPDYNLQLLSSDGTVVYETYVPSSVNKIQLPANLTGDYELQLQTERFIFTGEVEL